MKNIFIIGLILLLSSCSQPAKNEYVYWINSYKVACDGVGKMNCLLIQKGEKPEPGKWIYFYSNIEGFSFEPGNIYKLMINEEYKQNIPADASSIKYSLVKVLEKKPDLKININDIWLVTAINSAEVNREKEFQKDAEIEIQLSEMRISGTDGCNRFTGSITNFDDGIIEFGPIAGTRMICPNMEIADEFNAALSQVKKFRLEKGELILLSENDTELLRCKKFD